MPKNDLLPSVQEFVDAARDLFEAGTTEDELWLRIEAELRPLLADPALKAHAASWPETSDGIENPGNLLFYEDSDYGFVLNALVKQPDAETYIHDHGPSWTLYGVIEGGERITRYERTDGRAPGSEPAALRLVEETEVTPGYIDTVPPWEIHQECNGPHRTIGFIVRSQRSGTFTQHHYDPDSGEVTAYGGPRQIPFTLA